jgi:hypothetical protein
VVHDVAVVVAVPIVGCLVGSLFEPILGGLAEGPALVIPALVVVAALLAPQLAVVTQATRVRGCLEVWRLPALDSWRSRR